MPVFDIRCDDCGYTEENHLDKGGLEHYGPCPACSRGLMRQLIAPVRFNMTPRVETLSGRTSNGTKWEVGSKIGKIKDGKLK
jgi:hypothetical protein